MSKKEAKIKKCKCGAEVAKDEKVCHHCGANLRMGIVKKLLIGVAVVVVIGWMIPDSDVSTVTSPITPTPAPVVAVEKTPEQIAADKAVYDEAVKKADADLAVKATQDAADKVVADAKAAEDKKITDAKAAEDKKISDAKAVEDKKVADAKAAAAVEAAKPKHIAYKDLARKHDDYMGTNVIFTGEVIQVQEDGKYVGLRVNVTKNSYGYEDTMFVQYDKSLVSGRVLDKDIITFSGMSMGLLTYKTVLGAEMSIPQVLATDVKLK